MGPIRPPAAPAVWYVGVRNVAFLIAKGQKLSGGKCGPRPSAGTVLLLQTVLSSICRNACLSFLFNVCTATRLALDAASLA